MKIAVACKDNRIFEHFGHCEHFMIFNVENRDVMVENDIPNPGHKPGALPNFLARQGVNVVIASGMGESAIDIFNEHNIEIIVGAAGNARGAVDAYLRGELKSTGSVCHSHMYKNTCGEQLCF
ncbi:MAG: NifB/NifX family molybdenum-iron cluster-binding protein [Pyramidobacter sp.]|uniref:NifB/NifX family molybdenum-iron cluster-binding protein n=1 Tax=Pyramidobacter sp. TaxID=1943581 RepID=UPI002A7EA73F|nr:NifB/NifX family molybdenum-iron cluster-binding protein [Pyramidobacter sp.]MDY4033317.1 NifB/NifX family molybdenum-iron cluster-binding protein [Pyramidobacter sp.]